MSTSFASSRSSTASVKSRIDNVLTAPSFSKTGKNMRKLMKSAPSDDQTHGGNKDDGGLFLLGNNESPEKFAVNNVNDKYFEDESLDTSGMDYDSKKKKRDLNEINERRQAQFLEKTEAGRKILQSYLEKKEKAKQEPLGRNISSRNENRTGDQSQDPQSASSSKREFKPLGTSSFRTTSRKDMAIKSDAPPIGRYNPRYDLIDSRPKSVSLGRIGKKSSSPANTSKFQTTRDNNITNSPKDDYDTPTKNRPQTANAIESNAPSALRNNSNIKDQLDDKLTKKQKKEMKRYQDQVNRWIESRFGKEPSKELSSMKSTTAQRNITSDLKLTDLSYWPNSDPVKHMEKSKILVNMNRQTGRNDIGVKPKILDAVYQPNHDLRFPRTTVGNHNMDGFCDRESQMKTSRVGIESESNHRSKNDVGLHKFYDTDEARERHVYKKEERNLDIDKIVGREDPRNNYLLETEAKALKTKGTVLGGLEPRELLSDSSKIVHNISFSKQIERKFQPGFVMHDLDYNSDINPVKPKITYSMDFDATTERHFQPGFVLNDLMYLPNLDSSSKSLKYLTLVDMKRETSRHNNISAMMSRTTGLDPSNDIQYEKASEQLLKLEDRVKGDPFIRKQIGRSELERIAKRLRGTTDIFYQVEPKTFDLIQKREIRDANYNMQKITNRYEKFENTMTKDSISQNRPVGGKQVEPPFVVRGQSGVVLNDLTYNPKFDIVEQRPITHKIV